MKTALRRNFWQSVKKNLYTEPPYIFKTALSHLKSKYLPSGCVSNVLLIDSLQMTRVAQKQVHHSSRVCLV